ncbi:hypothetical protein [Actinoallomurus sp. NBC_01490]
MYDRTSRHNDLTIEGPGGAGGQDAGVPADDVSWAVGSPWTP